MRERTSGMESRWGWPPQIGSLTCLVLVNGNAVKRYSKQNAFPDQCKACKFPLYYGPVPDITQPHLWHGHRVGAARGCDYRGWVAQRQLMTCSTPQLNSTTISTLWPCAGWNGLVLLGHQCLGANLRPEPSRSMRRYCGCRSAGLPVLHDALGLFLSSQGSSQECPMNLIALISNSLDNDVVLSWLHDYQSAERCVEIVLSIVQGQQ